LEVLQPCIDVTSLLVSLVFGSHGDMLGKRSHGSSPVVRRVVVDQEKVLDALPQVVLEPLGQNIGLIPEDRDHNEEVVL
jgi:hypothetical protein